MKPIQRQSNAKKLNIGCGDHFHPDWSNVDVSAHHPSVLAWDVRQGLPFEDQSFDAVYHSHLLEHLSVADGERLMSECFRVLRSGGVLRVVVPDLETIATLYLEKLRLAESCQPDAIADYHWMKLELLDQMVRDRSGGLMGQYMASPSIQNSSFVRSRIGNEFWRCRPTDERPLTARAPIPRPKRKFRWVDSVRRFRERLARRSVRLLLGNAGEAALDSGLFRNQGEIHRWMYDRFSMSQLCQRLGFSQFQVCGPESSSIPDFASFQLDAIQGVVRKPDSLFIECRKPAAEAVSAATKAA